MKTCKTCSHWKLKAEGEKYIEHSDIVLPTDPDTYEPMKMPFEVRHCKSPALLFCERPLESDGFCVADGSTYMANLITGPDFGCLRHSDYEL